MKQVNQHISSTLCTLYNKGVSAVAYVYSLPKHGEKKDEKKIAKYLVVSDILLTHTHTHTHTGATSV